MINKTINLILSYSFGCFNKITRVQSFIRSIYRNLHKNKWTFLWIIYFMFWILNTMLVFIVKQWQIDTDNSTCIFFYLHTYSAERCSWRVLTKFFLHHSASSILSATMPYVFVISYLANKSLFYQGFIIKQDTQT